MAGRSLENLRKHYASGSFSGPGRGPMPVGPRRHGPGPGGPAMGKPKDVGRTVWRIFAYLKGSEWKLAAVVVCLLLGTAATLAGSYMLRPILNRVADGSLPAAERVSYLLSMLLVLLLGFVAYGLSIYFYVYAQRFLGAARTSAYYAVQPFIGVLLSLLIFREMPGMLFFAALALMIGGTWLVTKDQAE